MPNVSPAKWLPPVMVLYRAALSLSLFLLLAGLSLSSSVSLSLLFNPPSAPLSSLHPFFLFLSLLVSVYYCPFSLAVLTHFLSFYLCLSAPLPSLFFLCPCPLIYPCPLFYPFIMCKPFFLHLPPHVFPLFVILLHRSASPVSLPPCVFVILSE